MSAIETDYRWNKDFRDYVDKYATKHGITVEEALTHAEVREVWRYYTEL